MNNNIVKYIRKNKNISFDELPLNEIDALLFSMLSYSIYPNYLKYENRKLEDCIEDIINLNKLEKGISRKNGLLLLKELTNSIRYKDIIFSDYKREIGPDYQFGMIVITILNKYKYICFEGTDSSLQGWLEDFQISYIYPIKSTIKASYYLDEILENTNIDAVITGHSKGAYLAVTSSINSKYKNKIKKIYAFDGPGIDNKLFNSSEYKEIRNKIINIIPEQSFLGSLFNHENVKVIESIDFGIMQHSPINWQIKENKFKKGKRDKLSLDLSNTFNNWINKTKVEERRIITEGIFNILKELGITDFMEIDYNNLENVLNVIKSSLNLSSETKDILIASISLLVSEINNTIVNNIKDVLKW